MAGLDIVIFGGAGDLSMRKLMPALYHLFSDGKLSSDSRILIVSKDQLKRREFQKLVFEKISNSVSDGFSEDIGKAFVEIVEYKPIDLFISEHWSNLASFLESENGRERIYYLAVPPTLFGVICKQLKDHGLNSNNSRLIVEKPLGEDVNSAELINREFLAAFSEDQIYRIDHYLGKKSIQNLLVLRFSNRLFSSVWNNSHIENIQITVSETVGVEGRAEYLDRTGILRDMVQNHLMQILACLAMEEPLSLNADDIRDEKVKALKSIRKITNKNIKQSVTRAQYTSDNGMPGYLEELDASSGRAVGAGETFVALKLQIDNDRWFGVPFYLRTGKRLSDRYAQIVIQFKPMARNIYNVPEDNRIIINLQPDMDINIDLFMKKLLSNDSELFVSRYASGLEKSERDRLPDAYEKLLEDVMQSNQAFFVRHDEIIASWTLIDAVRKAWEEKNIMMDTYMAGSMGPDSSDDLLAADGHSWYGEKS